MCHSMVHNIPLLLIRRRMISDKDIDNWFTYHPPSVYQAGKYQTIREAGHALASAIVNNTPPSADQTAAIRKVREAIMTANAAIACE